MDDPPKTVRRTLAVGRAEEEERDRRERDRTGPDRTRPLPLAAAPTPNGAWSGNGGEKEGRGAAWPKKSSKSVGRSSPGRTKDRRRRFPLRPSLNHSSPPRLSRPFSTPSGPFVLSSAPSPLSSFAFPSSFFKAVFKEQRASRSGRMPAAPACDEEGRAVVPGRAREGTRERKMALT